MTDLNNNNNDSISSNFNNFKYELDKLIPRFKGEPKEEIVSVFLNLYDSRMHSLGLFKSMSDSCSTIKIKLNESINHSTFLDDLNTFAQELSEGKTTGDYFKSREDDIENKKYRFVLTHETILNLSKEDAINHIKNELVNNCISSELSEEELYKTTDSLIFNGTKIKTYGVSFLEASAELLYNAELALTKHKSKTQRFMNFVKKETELNLKTSSNSSQTILQTKVQ